MILRLTGSDVKDRHECQNNETQFKSDLNHETSKLCSPAKLPDACDISSLAEDITLLKKTPSERKGIASVTGFGRQKAF